MKKQFILCLIIFGSLVKYQAQITIDTAPSDDTADCTDSSDPDANADFQVWLMNNGNGLASSGCGTITDPWPTAYSPGDWDVSDPCNIFVDVTWDVEDDCGSTVIQVTATFTIIDVDPPLLNSAAEDGVAECDGTDTDSHPDVQVWLINNANADFDDDCSAANNLTWFNDYDISNFVPSTSCDPNQFVGSISVDFWTEDECGNISGMTTATFTIEDTSAPDFISPPADITVDCNSPDKEMTVIDWISDISNSGNISDFSDCSDPASIIVTNDYDGSLPGCGGTKDVEFTVTDECGNVSTAVATIYMESFATSVSFQSNATNTVEGNTTSGICLQISNESSTVATDVEVMINSSGTVINGTDIMFVDTVQNFQFPAASFADICFDVEIIDDMEIETSETIQFDITNVTGGVNAAIGNIPTHTFTIIDNDDNDGDGIGNDIDNCPDISNPIQEDIDEDGIGDVCDNSNQVDVVSEFEENIFVSKAHRGIILKSENGNCFILVVSDNGSFQSIPVECP